MTSPFASFSAQPKSGTSVRTIDFSFTDVEKNTNRKKQKNQYVGEKAKELAFLVRVKQVNFTESCKEYKNDDIDGQKIRISVE